MARVVSVSIPKHKLLDVQLVLSQSTVIDSYDISSSSRVSSSAGIEELAKITFKLKGTNLARTIKELKDVGVGELYGEIDVIPLSCTTQTLVKDRHRLHTALNCCQSRYNRFSTLEIHHGIIDGSHMTFDHMMLITCAACIAAVGLLCDQIVAILASFFISPLMQMIIATAWGVVIGDWRLVGRGCRNVVLGAIWCLLVGMAIGAILCSHTDTRHDFTTMYRGSGLYYAISINSVQITSRGPPAVASLLCSMAIAIFSGVAIALGFASGISSALSGVALSASLLPPVVNTGLMLVLGIVYPDMRCGPIAPHDQYTLHEVAAVSISLYVVNVLCVMIFAVITFKFKRIGGLSLKEQGWESRTFTADAPVSFATSKSASPLAQSPYLDDLESPRVATPWKGSQHLGSQSPDWFVDVKDEALLTVQDREALTREDDCNSPRIA